MPPAKGDQQRKLRYADQVRRATEYSVGLAPLKLLRRVKSCAMASWIGIVASESRPVRHAPHGRGPPCGAKWSSIVRSTAVANGAMLNLLPSQAHPKYSL